MSPRGATSSASSTPIRTSPSCSTRTSVERARRDALARVQRLSPGDWDADVARGGRRPPPGFLIVDGLLSREVDVLGRSCVELLGPGDVMRPWSWDDEGSHVQAEVGWQVLEPTRLAVLDHGLVVRIVPWPQLGVELFNRGTRRAHHLAVALAIAHHQRVDDRLLLTLWHLAERWGRVPSRRHRPLPLPLGHQRLADLVGGAPPDGHDRARRTSPGPGRDQARRDKRDWVLHRRASRASCATTRLVAAHHLAGVLG
jgi:hypothetical protein